MQEAAHICSRNCIGHGQGGTLEMIGRALRVRSYISETPKSPIIIIIYYHLFSLSLLLSLSLSLLLFVADTWRVSPLYFHRSGLLTFISINSARLPRRLFEFLRVRHSLTESYRSVVVSIRFREKWAFFQSSGNIAYG